MIRKLWDRYNVYAGILGLIVDCITLWGYIGIKFSLKNIGSSQTIQIIPNTTIVDLPFSLQRFLYISTAAIIIFSFLILAVYLPRRGYYHLCDYYKELSDKRRNKKLSADEVIELLDFNRQDKVGLSHAFYGIGIYSVIVNLLIVSPIALIWSRVFLFLPLDNHIFFVALITLSFTSANLLFLQKLNSQFSSKSHFVELVLIVEILITLIVAYTVTEWSIPATFGFLSLTVLAIVAFLMVAKILREKIVFLELTDEWVVSDDAFINWTKEKLNELEKKIK